MIEVRHSNVHSGRLRMCMHSGRLRTHIGKLPITCMFWDHNHRSLRHRTRPPARSHGIPLGVGPQPVDHLAPNNDVVVLRAVQLIRQRAELSEREHPCTC